MITASKTETPYCVTITNGDTSIYSDVAKERGGKTEAFRPHEFLCAAYALVFISLYVSYWIKKNYPMNK